jgi:triosephosphate isomerase
MSDSHKTYIIANWKMNFTVGEASLYLHKLSDKITGARNLQIILAPPTIALQPLSLQVNRREFKLAAQNLYHRDFGAYTGETSASQLRGIVDYALLGHSEGRHIFGETDKDIREKVAAALRNNITPILCIGETADERNFGETDLVLYDQLIGGLSEVSAEDIPKVLIAYEPVWAISSAKDAKLATPEEVLDAVQRIRAHLSHLHTEKIAEATPVLYGGSVSPTSAAAYLTVPGVNGLLIGGASLIADSFTSIVNLTKGLLKNE